MGRIEATVEPARTDRLGAGAAGTVTEGSVGSDHGHLGTLSCPCELGEQRVVTAANGMHHAYAVGVRLGGSGPGIPLQDDHHRAGERPAPGRRTELPDKRPRRAGPVPPPPSRTGADDVRRVDHEHAVSLAPPRKPGPESSTWATRVSARPEARTGTFPGAPWEIDTRATPPYRIVDP